jgi:NAD(P)-dependent dehydrogenase (short-subunit alcohol dehydrogenase family)
VTEEEAEARLAAIIPLRRAVDPDEIASTVAFLCSPLARSITGVTVPVDGGRHLAR